MGAWDTTCGGRTVHLDRSDIGVAPLGSNSEEASHEDQKEEVGAGSGIRPQLIQKQGLNFAHTSLCNRPQITSQSEFATSD
jgi:hypothetical protein